MKKEDKAFPETFVDFFKTNERCPTDNLLGAHKGSLKTCLIKSCILDARQDLDEKSTMLFSEIRKVMALCYEDLCTLETENLEHNFCEQYQKE